jgi:hypothetical protein
VAVVARVLLSSLGKPEKANEGKKLAAKKQKSQTRKIHSSGFLESESSMFFFVVVAESGGRLGG